MSGAPAQAADMGEQAAPRTGIGLFLSVTIPLYLLFLITANWALPYHIDAATNVFTAWELGTEGDVYLEGHEELAEPDYFANLGWIVEAKDSVASQYPPGTAVLAAPLYAVWPGTAPTMTVYGTNKDAPGVDVEIPPLAPAAIISAAVAAIAAGIFAMAFRQLTDHRTALYAAYVLGLATGLWSIASDSLWQHGPGMLWIGAGALLSIRHRSAAGLAYGAAILTRPHTALVAAANGVGQAWRERSILPALKIGLGASAGMAALLWFNYQVFGSASITGGYGSAFSGRAASTDILDYLGNIALALVHPTRGLLVFSPFLIFLLPGLPAAWKMAPAWVRGSAVGGALYLLVQLKANRYSGGEGFWGYRYPLETLAAAAPLLLLCYTEWVREQSVLIRKLFRWAVAGSVLLTAAGAVVYGGW